MGFASTTATLRPRRCSMPAKAPPAHPNSRDVAAIVEQRTHKTDVGDAGLATSQYVTLLDASLVIASPSSRSLFYDGDLAVRAGEAGEDAHTARSLISLLRHLLHQQRAALPAGGMDSAGTHSSGRALV